MRVPLGPSFRGTWLPAGLIALALAVFAVLAFRVPGDLRLVSPEIDADLPRPPAGPEAAGAGLPDPARRARLVVHVSRARNTTGTIAVAVHDRGPLTEGAAVAAFRTVAASPGGSTVVFEDLPQGTYAVTAFHDEDGDERVDGLPGRPPSEGVGVSGTGSRPSGPPVFEDAKFALDRDELELEIPLFYF